MKEQLLKTLDNSRTYTLAVLQAMPENKMDSRPAEGIWNFRELMNHIAYGIRWWEQNFVLKKEMDWDPPAIKSSRQEIGKELNASYDSLKKTLETARPTEEVVHGFQATMDHITHHRGQAVIHLRYNNITPPEYTF